VDVKLQTSSGGVVYRRNGELQICLIKPTGRRLWALPKGSIEAGETPPVTAAREIREETGIVGAVEDALGAIDYWFYSRDDKTRVHKTVHFFVVRAIGGDTADHDHEVSDAQWFTVARALEKMTYPNEREMVRKALSLLDGERAASTTR
jgi:8-oxo-dGTP pyrophosphatase MutT (NUDIX family)